MLGRIVGDKEHLLARLAQLIKDLGHAIDHLPRVKHRARAIERLTSIQAFNGSGARWPR